MIPAWRLLRIWNRTWAISCAAKERLRFGTCYPPGVRRGESEDRASCIAGPTGRPLRCTSASRLPGEVVLMRGEFIGVWSETWREIWDVLASHEAAPGDLFCELYRELAA